MNTWLSRKLIPIISIVPWSCDLAPGILMMKFLHGLCVDGINKVHLEFGNDGEILSCLPSELIWF